MAQIAQSARRFRFGRAGGDTADRTLSSPLGRQRPSGRIAYGVLLLLLFVATLTTIVPLIWMFFGGLKTSTEIFANPPDFLPKQARWENFHEAWNGLRFGLYFRNTFLIALGTWFSQLFVASLAAYSLSMLRPMFGNVILFLFISTLMVPAEAYLIPLYLTVLDLPVLHLDLSNTWFAIWLPAGVSAFNIFLLKSFFDQIPRDLVDAATLDGAGTWQVFIQIVLPLSKPVIAVVSIFAFINSWKDFFWPLLVLSNPDIQPISVALYRLANHESLNLVIAALSIASVPPLVLFLIFQRQIIAGITFGGLKG